MPGIFVIKEDGSLVEMGETRYEDEDTLQGLLESYPGLLTGESGADGIGRRYVLVRREAGVPESEGGGDRWSLDHLFLDDEGVPTLVEVKRSSDTRIRREVVGQMLDYAANIIAYWPIDRMRTEFETRCAESNLDPEATIHEVCDDDYEDYWQGVKTNLEARRLRLVFLADDIPPTLQTIVEFLNEQMRSTEVIAVEVKRHQGEGMSTLVSRVIGRTAASRQTKQSGPPRQWGEESLMAEFQKRFEADEAAAAQAIYTHMLGNGTTAQFGQGATYGGVVFLTSEGAAHTGIGLYTGQGFSLYPSEMASHVDREIILELFRKLEAIPGWRVPEEYAEKSYRGLPLAPLVDPGALTALLNALDWFLGEMTGVARTRS